MNGSFCVKGRSCAIYVCWEGKKFRVICSHLNPDAHVCGGFGGPQHAGDDTAEGCACPYLCGRSNGTRYGGNLSAQLQRLHCPSASATPRKRQSLNIAALILPSAPLFSSPCLTLHCSVLACLLPFAILGLLRHACLVAPTTTSRQNPLSFQLFVEIVLFSSLRVETGQQRSETVGQIHHLARLLQTFGMRKVLIEQASRREVDRRYRNASRNRGERDARPVWTRPSCWTRAGLGTCSELRLRYTYPSSSQRRVDEKDTIHDVSRCILRAMFSDFSANRAAMNLVQRRRSRRHRWMLNGAPATQTQPCRNLNDVCCATPKTCEETMGTSRNRARNRDLQRAVEPTLHKHATAHLQ